MAERGVYFDPNFLVLHNYLDNKAKFLGIGNYNERGFAYMEKGAAAGGRCAAPRAQGARENRAGHRRGGGLARAQRRRIHLSRERTAAIARWTP